MPYELPSLLKAVLLLAFGLLPACRSHGSTSSPSQVEPTAPSSLSTSTPPRELFGAPLTASTEWVSLKQLLQTPSRYANETIRTEGKVTAVCEHRGCWLELGDNEASSAHIKLQGHRFFVPRNAVGKTAEVEAKVLPPLEKGHCEQEAEEQTGQVAKIELEATGVELFNNRE